MLIWDDPARVNRWMKENGGGWCHPGTFTALGWEIDGEIVGGTTFFDSNGVSCSVGLAIKGGAFPVGLLKASLHYVFGQLKLRRSTHVIESSNLRSIELTRRLGAKHEATLREAGRTGDLLIFALFPEDCPIWRKLNAKRYCDPTSA